MVLLCGRYRIEKPLGLVCVRERRSLLLSAMNLLLLSSILFASDSRSSTMRTRTDGPSLRIIQINDVYELDAFPSLKTLIDSKQRRDENPGPDKTLIVCAGDFLAPSLLSSLDQGASMIDCLNEIGTTHVCLGNHEADVPPQALRERIRQSRFAWINSNLPELRDRLSDLSNDGDYSGADESPLAPVDEQQLPEYCIIDVTSKKDTTKIIKKVALLGLLTNDASLYRPSAFLDAKIEPVTTCASALVDKLAPQGIALIVPLTHQSIREDREFCRTFTGRAFPVVCGGHDHEVFDEVVAGSRIVKAGMDATHRHH